MRRLIFLIAFVFALSACSGNKNAQKTDPTPVEPVDSGPSAEELFVKANKQLDQRAWDKAIASYDRAIEKDPALWAAHMNRGIALGRSGDFKKALAAFEQALQQGGAEKAEVYYNLGNLYQERAMYSAAVDAYRMSLALETNPNIDTLLNLSAAYVFLRQYDSANQTYEYIRTLAPDDPRPLHGLGLVQQLNDHFQDAVGTYEQVHALAPQFALSYFNKARCLAQMQDWDEAIGSLQDFLRHEPEGPTARRAKTMIEIYTERRDKGPTAR